MEAYSHSLGAQAVPYRVTNTRGKYSVVVIPPMFTYSCRPIYYIDTYIYPTWGCPTFLDNPSNTYLWISFNDQWQHDGKVCCAVR
jgi:hypothetical protein